MVSLRETTSLVRMWASHPMWLIATRYTICRRREGKVRRYVRIPLELSVNKPKPTFRVPTKRNCQLLSLSLSNTMILAGHLIR